MLNGTTDAASNVDLRTNGDSRLTNLQVMIGKAGIDSGTTCAHLCMEYFCQFIELGKAFSRTYAITAGNDDASTFEVILGGLHMTIEHLSNIFRFRHELSHILDDDLTLIIGIKHLCLHDTTADSSHLGTILGVDNSCHDVTSKCGTNLIKEILIGLARSLILMRTNLQCRTIGRQTAVQGTADTRSKVTTNHIGTHQADLRLFLLEQIHEHCRMRL